MKTTQKGKLTEQACCDFLTGKGLKLVERNYRCRRGEIDLVMTDSDCLVFIEVRYRSRDDYGSALASVDYRKQQKLMITVQHYIREHNIDQPTRLDVVGMSPDRNQAYAFEWVRDAIQVA